MVFLLLAILSSTLISVGMRASERYISNNMSMLAVNYAACALVAALCAGGSLSPAAVAGPERVFPLALVSGALYLAGFVLFQWNVSKNGVVLSSTFMKLGVLVPIALSVLLFREMPTLWQLLGCAGAVAAILLVQLEGGSERASNRGGLLFLLLAGGLADAMSKVFEETCLPETKDSYLFYTFLFALLLCAGLILHQKQHLGRAEVLFGLLVGVPNYFSSRFLLLALNTVPAVVVFPTFSVGTIVAVSLAGRLLFRETLSRRRQAALGLILLSLVLLNL